MSKHLHSQHHYNVCERDYDGVLWCIRTNLSRESLMEFLKEEDLSMYHEIVVVMVETNTFDVSFEFMECD